MKTKIETKDIRYGHVVGNDFELFCGAIDGDENQIGKYLQGFDQKTAKYLGVLREETGSRSLFSYIENGETKFVTGCILELKKSRMRLSTFNSWKPRFYTGKNLKKILEESKRVMLEAQN